MYSCVHIALLSQAFRCIAVFIQRFYLKPLDVQLCSYSAFISSLQMNSCVHIALLSQTFRCIAVFTYSAFLSSLQMYSCIYIQRFYLKPLDVQLCSYSTFISSLQIYSCVHIALFSQAFRCIAVFIQRFLSQAFRCIAVFIQHFYLKPLDVQLCSYSAFISSLQMYSCVHIVLLSQTFRCIAVFIQRFYLKPLDVQLCSYSAFISNLQMYSCIYIALLSQAFRCIAVSTLRFSLKPLDVQLYLHCAFLSSLQMYSCIYIALFSQAYRCIAVFTLRFLSQAFRCIAEFTLRFYLKPLDVQLYLHCAFLSSLQMYSCIYIALFLFPKSFTGRGGKHHQCVASTLRQNAHHTSPDLSGEAAYIRRLSGGRVEEPGWEFSQNPTALCEARHGIFQNNSETVPRFNVLSEKQRLLQRCVPVAALERWDLFNQREDRHLTAHQHHFQQQLGFPRTSPLQVQSRP